MHGSANVNLRSLELTFSKKISSLFTGEHIKDEEGMSVAVTLIDSRTKEKVKSGPEASGKVEIVVIEAQVDKFEGIFVHMEGSKPVPVPCLSLKLIQGTAFLPTVYFGRHNTKWLKKSRIRLGARFLSNCNFVHVKEAQTEPFDVEDNRNDSKKHAIPSLHDDVWRLEKVDKKSLARSLKEANIKTVEDFIICLFLRPQDLNEIFISTRNENNFNVTVEHARKCPAILMYGSSPDQKSAVVFNVKGEVLQLYLEGQFLYWNTLSESQKEVAMKLVVCAFNNWADVNKIISLDHDMNLDIKELSLFGNMLPDEKDPNPQFLPEPLRACYDEIHSGFKNIFTSNQHQSETVFGIVAAQKNKFNNKRKIMIRFVGINIRILAEKKFWDIHVHKKPRFS